MCRRFPSGPGGSGADLIGNVAGGRPIKRRGLGKKEHGRKKPKYSVNPLGTQNKDISEFIIVRTVHQVRRKAPPLSEASNKCI